MFEFFRSLVGVFVPVFVVSTMLNVGLTQKPSTILGYLRDWPFVLKMLAANFIAAPALMIVMLHMAPFDLPLKEGLLLFSMCAGAPFLIKLTQRSQNDMALGAATMMLLMVFTVLYVPVVLPMILTEVTVDAWAIARTLLVQMLLPIAAGMLFAQFLAPYAAAAQPWVARLGNITLYGLTGATLLGYIPNMISIVGTGAILVVFLFLAGAFGAGYLAGHGADHLEDVGALGTAQRNTAACVIIATRNFEDPNVLVIITLANTLGLVILLVVAKALSRDNRVRFKMV